MQGRCYSCAGHVLHLTVQEGRSFRIARLCGACMRDQDVRSRPPTEAELFSATAEAKAHEARPPSLPATPYTPRARRVRAPREHRAGPMTVRHAVEVGA